jgi:hypothetical protein
MLIFSVSGLARIIDLTIACAKVGPFMLPEQLQDIPW